MKTYKKIISLIVTLSLFTTLSVGTYGNSVTALELTKQKKISSVLLKEMDGLKRNETVPIYVEFEDIGKDFIEQKVDEQTGMTLTQIEQLEDKYLNSEELKNASNEELDTLLPKYFKETESKREYIQSLVNNRIMTERSIAKKLYDKQNEEYVEQIGIDKTDIEFVSSYSPMVITECTENEIDDIVVQSKVKSIDIHEDVQIVPEENQISETEAETTATSASSYTTAWKSAISADITTNTIGIKGDGVTVGVLDKYTVNASHSDLVDTNITVLDKPNYAIAHGTKVTRILAGSNGVVPEAKIYTTSTNSTPTTPEAEIERLINSGVSLINISLAFGERNNDYYNQFEKWIDHVSYKHDVLIVISAGNVSTLGNNIVGGGALSYNSLTVGGINTMKPETSSDDVFHTDTCYANGDTLGCAKPDCEAAFNDVLKEDWNGTSFAAPAVTGVCAQVLQTKPSLSFRNFITKAIIMASCDRKGTESYANGLTSKEGSGVVNAQKAVIIASTNRYEYQIKFPYAYTLDENIDYVKRGSPSKLVVCWEIHSSPTDLEHLSGSASSRGCYNYDLSVYSSKGTLLKESNIANSSAEAVVFNSENDTLEVNCHLILIMNLA